MKIKGQILIAIESMEKRMVFRIFIDKQTKWQRKIQKCQLFKA